MTTRPLFEVLRCPFQFVESFSIFLDMAANNILENNDQNSRTERLVSLTDDNVEKFLKAEENKSKQRETQRDVVFVMAFLVVESETRRLEDLQPQEMTIS